MRWCVVCVVCVCVYVCVCACVCVWRGGGGGVVCVCVRVDLLCPSECMGGFCCVFRLVVFATVCESGPAATRIAAMVRVNLSLCTTAARVSVLPSRICQVWGRDETSATSGTSLLTFTQQDIDTIVKLAQDLPTHDLLPMESDAGQPILSLTISVSTLAGGCSTLLCLLCQLTRVVIRI